MMMVSGTKQARCLLYVARLCDLVVCMPVSGALADKTGKQHLLLKFTLSRTASLVKVCQAPLDPPVHTEPNWEFLLRICDATGKGLTFKSALPEK